MSKGVRIAYISGGFSPRFDNPIHQPFFIAGDDEETEEQALLNEIISADALSFYSLNVSKAQLTDLMNQYNNGDVPTGWSVAVYNQALAVIDSINYELSSLGSRQYQIKTNPDIKTEVGVDEEFAEYVGVGAVPVVVIIVAIIVGGALIYELIDWLQAMTVESAATVEQTEILKKAAMDLTPEEQKLYWDDIQRQVDKAYKSGYAAGDGGSLLGDIAGLAPYILGGVVLYFAWPLLADKRNQYKAKSAASKVAGAKCKICALKKRKNAKR